MILQRSIELRVPITPNYIFAKDGDYYTSVGDLSNDALREIAKEWTEALLENAARQRRAKEQW